MGILRTPVQKRRQVILLKELVDENKRSFNRHFDEMFNVKIAEMDKIEQKNDRIHEIVQELGIEKDYLKPTWKPMENPEKVLEVLPSEMTKSPYETRAMRKKREE